MTHHAIDPKRLEISNIKNWLHQGWQDFTKASFISIAYAAIFCVIGGIVGIWLVSAGKALIFFMLAGGFMLISPILVTGYYRVSQLLREGKEPEFDDIPRAFRSNPEGILSIGAIIAVVFLIWMTDAILIYSLIFGQDDVAIRSITSEPGVRGNVIAFTLFASILGSILAFVIYTLTAFSIQDAFHRGSRFSAAIVTSIRGVFRNLDVMLVWAGILTLLTFGTLLLALPLIIVLFPVLGYASYAAYLDVTGQENASTDASGPGS